MLLSYANIWMVIQNYIQYILAFGGLLFTFRVVKPLKPDERQKFILLSLVFCLIIGIYWMFRPLKDSIFMTVVGENYIPDAKWLSLAVVFPLVILYSKLVDMFPRHKMFYALCTIYAVLALVFAVIMCMPGVGLAHTVASKYRLWGWAWYVYVESFGSLIVALFWAFAGDTSTPESAERGYPLVAYGGQIGNIFGPLLLNVVVHRFTHFELGADGELPAEAAQQSAYVLAGMVVIAAIVMVAIMALVKYFMTAIPKHQLTGYQAKGSHEKAEPGFFEGFKLFMSSPYLLGIFAIITAFEVIVTVFDFNFKTLVKIAYPAAHASTLYLSGYAMWVGIISLYSIVLGINKTQKFFGVGISLALLPLVIAGAVLGFKLYPILGVLFWIMVFSKAINYALNQPTLKQLYIPTTQEARYKSQAFVEMYGSRGSKALGSAINKVRGSLIAKYGPTAGLDLFVSISAYASLGIIGAWLFIALYLGRTFKQAVDDKRVIV